jgi:hypothetical protein
MVYFKVEYFRDNYWVYPSAVNVTLKGEITKPLPGIETVWS